MIAENGQRRYYVKTGYHYWSIIDRGPSGWKDTLVWSIGARGIGDAEARRRLSAELARLNGGDA